MKTLHVVRHAKSSWKKTGLRDHDRPLNGRGRRNAPLMGAYLAGSLSAPPPVFCSTALRARETVAGLGEGWPALIADNVIYDDRLYTFDARDLLRWLQVADDALDELMIVGHNPALTDLCNHLCGTPVLDNLPTAGYLCLRLNVDAWVDSNGNCAQLVVSRFPKQLAPR